MMNRYMVKSYKRNVWTVLGWVYAEDRNQAWDIAIARWGNKVSHVTDFLE